MEPETAKGNAVTSVTKALTQGLNVVKNAIEGDASSSEKPSGDTEVETGSGQTTRTEEMMPPWNNVGFWEVVANKLQVNSSKERVCNLGSVVEEVPKS